MNGHELRALKWTSVNWSNTDSAIARFLGVTYKAVALQRRARGIPPGASRGGNSTKERPYKP